MTGFAIVSTTVASRENAGALAEALVTAKLAACVQILPIESVYAWKGEIERGVEHLLLCKITEADFSAVAEAIQARHGYDVPEIVMTPISAGSHAYLDWLARETSRKISQQDQ